MYRLMRPNSVRDALLDERDDISVKISLLRDADSSDRTKLDELMAQLADLEKCISKHKRMP